MSYRARTGKVALLMVTLCWALLGRVQTAIDSVTPDGIGNFSTIQKGVHFAVVGDYGDNSQNEAQVATLINSWSVDFIITTGDNNYPSGKASTIDKNIGQYYHSYIFPYIGTFGSGSNSNRFWPALGNHDWDSGTVQAYLDYFTLPGNERYYTFVRGPVQCFVVDSDNREPDGVTSTSKQALWLKAQLAASTSPWKIVYMHHPPYSSCSKHGSTLELQWPYQSWGAIAVMSGHDHTYERLVIDGFPYFVNGIGGNRLYSFGTPLSGSQVRYNANSGAMLVDATDNNIVFKCFSITGALVDSFEMNLGPPPMNISPSGRPGSGP